MDKLKICVMHNRGGVRSKVKKIKKYQDMLEYDSIAVLQTRYSKVCVGNASMIQLRIHRERQ